ncbi:DMT family transporter [Thalassotalea marina]|uniref:EamA domain-containing protein n=1 Tax=Thalassotalea marina TaxID=1673741 RepID=A0A919EJY7_9GAMM|nr:DMT family transporter [Thalassotalea marina]GHF89762.1 hypothetical protein GCM10017161_17110 [Thalassotalea marina]
MNNEGKIHYAALHGAVLLFALSGLFAKWLSISAIDIVFGRAFFAALALFLFIKCSRNTGFYVSQKLLLALTLSGALLAAHWTSFFHAIQLANVSLGLITFATFPVMVSLLEPLCFKESFKMIRLAQAALTVFGVYWVIPQVGISEEQVQGCLWGLFSAFTFAILTLVNRKFVVSQSAKIVACYQNAVAALLLLPFISFFDILPSGNTMLGLLVLGVIFTALSHSLFNFSLKKLSGHTASVAVSLEPIYGAIAAYILLAEPLTGAFIFGGSVILLSNYWVLKSH